MNIHFDNHAAAAAHLTNNGWRQQPQRGRWISRDGWCAAHILTTPADPVVLVQAWKINEAEAA